jgi:hypothetical protein
MEFTELMGFIVLPESTSQPNQLFNQSTYLKFQAFVSCKAKYFEIPTCSGEEWYLRLGSKGYVIFFHLLVQKRTVNS